MLLPAYGGHGIRLHIAPYRATFAQRPTGLLIHTDISSKKLARH